MANKVFRTSVNANEAIKAANEFDGGLMVDSLFGKYI